MSERAAGVVRPSTEPELKPVARARGVRMAVLVGPDDGAPNFVTRRFVLEPGGRIPAHRHPDVEHEQYVVNGEMVLALDGVEHVARAGDAVFIPAQCVHAYENRGQEACEFLCVVPRTERYDTEWLEAPPEGAHLPE